MQKTIFSCHSLLLGTNVPNDNFKFMYVCTVQKESLVRKSLANHQWFAKLKPSKLVRSYYYFNLLTDMFIWQTFFPKISFIHPVSSINITMYYSCYTLLCSTYLAFDYIIMKLEVHTSKFAVMWKDIQGLLQKRWKPNTTNVKERR